MDSTSTCCAARASHERASSPGWAQAGEWRRRAHHRMGLAQPPHDLAAPELAVPSAQSGRAAFAGLGRLRLLGVRLRRHGDAALSERLPCGLAAQRALEDVGTAVLQAWWTESSEAERLRARVEAPFSLRYRRVGHTSQRRREAATLRRRHHVAVIVTATRRLVDGARVRIWSRVELPPACAAAPVGRHEPDGVRLALRHRNVAGRRARKHRLVLRRVRRFLGRDPEVDPSTNEVRAAAPAQHRAGCRTARGGGRGRETITSADAAAQDDRAMAGALEPAARPRSILRCAGAAR